MIITIDGCVATGKSTIAKMLAEAIGFIYFDTGAMYRVLTYGILKKGINPQQEEELAAFLAAFQLEVKNLRGQRHYFFENEEVTQKIRGEQVTAAVSQISALKPIREKLVALQREMALGVNAVFEGRDMGTVVFPDAPLKIFLTGKNEVRAKRRYEELCAKFPEEAAHFSLEKCLEEIEQRDLYDSTRQNSPLRQAEGAFVIDTTYFTPQEIIYKILEYKDSLKTKAFNSN